MFRILQYWVLTVNQSNILYSYALSNHQHNCREGKTLILQELIFNGNEFFPQVHDESRQIVCLIEYFDHFLETFNLVTGLHCTVLLSLWKDYFKVLISVVTKIKKKHFSLTYNQFQGEFPLRVISVNVREDEKCSPSIGRMELQAKSLLVG